MADGTKDDPWNLTTPPLALGLTELTHDARNNSMRGI
jgi:hypothetical protein